MRASSLAALAVWIAIVGGNILNTLTMDPRAFMNGPRLPWIIVLLPVVVIFGAFQKRRKARGEIAMTNWIDSRFGQGTCRSFIQTLMPELLFAAMCFSIVLTEIARRLIFGMLALPPEIMGFFVSGGLAFVAAHYIRRRREAA